MGGGFWQYRTSDEENGGFFGGLNRDELIFRLPRNSSRTPRNLLYLVLASFSEASIVSCTDFFDALIRLFFNCSISNLVLFMSDRRVRSSASSSEAVWKKRLVGVWVTFEVLLWVASFGALTDLESGRSGLSQRRSQLFATLDRGVYDCPLTHTSMKT